MPGRVVYCAVLVSHRRDSCHTCHVHPKLSGVSECIRIPDETEECLLDSGAKRKEMRADSVPMQKDVLVDT